MVSVVTDPADFYFRVNDTQPTRVNKLENLRLFSLGIDEYILGGVRRMVSDQFQGSGNLAPRKMKSVSAGLVRIIAGEGETLEFISDVTLATIPWLKVEAGKSFVSFWRAMLTEDNGLPDPDTEFGFAIYDANGAYLGLHALSTRTDPWDVSDGWVMDRAVTTSTAIKAQYSGGAYVRGYWRRYGGSVDTVNLSQALISDAASFEDIDAAITAERLLRESADAALAASITTVQSNVAANTAAIVAETAARTTADSALASSVTTLTARVNSRPNLIPNGSGEDGIVGWDASGTSRAAQRNFWGPHIYAVGWSGTAAALYSPFFPVYGGNNYTFAGEIECFGTPGPVNTYYVIQWYNGATYIPGEDDYTPVIAGNRAYTDSGSNRQANAASFVAPATATRARMVAVANYANAADISTFSTRQNKAEQGLMPPTPYTAEAQVTVSSQAATDAYGRTRAFWQVNAVAGGRAQLSVYADANGGAGVDIIGDLSVSGNAVVNGTITAPKILVSGVDITRLDRATMASADTSPVIGNWDAPLGGSSSRQDNYYPGFETNNLTYGFGVFTFVLNTYLAYLGTPTYPFYLDLFEGGTLVARLPIGKSNSPGILDNYVMLWFNPSGALRTITTRLNVPSDNVNRGRYLTPMGGNYFTTRWSAF